MAFRRDGTYGSDEAAHRKHDEKAKPDEGSRLQAAGRKVGITRADAFVEADNLLVQLSAHAADKEIAVRPHQAQDDGRPVLDLPVRLREGREDDIASLHPLTSRTVYVGSASP